SQNNQADMKLRAYALCDLGDVMKTLVQYERAASLLEKSLDLVPLDSKLAVALINLSGIYLDKPGAAERRQIILERALAFYRSTGDKYGLIYALSRASGRHFLAGRFQTALQLKRQAVEELISLPSESLFLKM